MTTLLCSGIEADADDLEGRWGIPVALDMLRERLISSVDFFELCCEAADGCAKSHVLHSDPV